MLTEREQEIDKRLKRGATVRVKSNGSIAILGDIQAIHNRYQLRNVSGWQRGVNDLEYMDNESLISTIQQLRTRLAEVEDEAANAMIKLREESTGNIQMLGMQKEVIERLRQELKKKKPFRISSV